MSEKEDEKRKSELILSINTNEREWAYCSSNLNFSLFSVRFFREVKQGEVELFICCPIPKFFVNFESFHRIYILGILHLFIN